MRTNAVTDIKSYNTLRAHKKKIFSGVLDNRMVLVQAICNPSS